MACAQLFVQLPALFIRTLALAADLEHWLADEPVSAYREPWTTRCGRWMRRHKPAVAAAAAAILAAVLLGAVGAWLWERQQAERRGAVWCALDWRAAPNMRSRRQTGSGNLLMQVPNGRHTERSPSLETQSTW